MTTKQEEIWSGQFGDAYVDRNQRVEQLAAKTAFFAKILNCTRSVDSVLELGANVGLNMQAISRLLPEADLYAVEINEKAYNTLKQIERLKAWNDSLFGFRPPKPVALSFTAGVLIHLNPDRLSEAYAALYEGSDRYVVIAEYYNPTPIEVPYRGQTEALFKRDWAGEMMDTYSDLRLVDYGFQYRRDPIFPMDDLTWFVLEKR